MSTTDDAKTPQQGIHWPEITLDTHEKELRTRIEHDSNNSNLWYFLGLHLRSMRRTVEAIKAFEQAARLNDDDFRIWGALAILYRDSGDVASADAAWFKMQDIIKRGRY